MPLSIVGNQATSPPPPPPPSEQEGLTRRESERAGRAEAALEETRSQVSRLEKELEETKVALEQSRALSASNESKKRTGGRRPARQSVPSRGDSRKKL